MFFSTVRHGLMANYRKTTPRSGPGPVTSRPSSSTVPRVFGRSPARMFRRVVLPHPLGPTTVKNSPSSTSRSTPSSATTRSLVNGLTYSCPSPRIVIFAVTSSAFLLLSAASARWLQIGEELRVHFHHFLDETKLKALLPRDR